MYITIYNTNTYIPPLLEIRSGLQKLEFKKPRQNRIQDLSHQRRKCRRLPDLPSWSSSRRRNQRCYNPGEENSSWWRRQFCKPTHSYNRAAGFLHQQNPSDLPNKFMFLLRVDSLSKSCKWRRWISQSKNNELRRRESSCKWKKKKKTQVRTTKQRKKKREKESRE